MITKNYSQTDTHTRTHTCTHILFYSLSLSFSLSLSLSLSPCFSFSILCVVSRSFTHTHTHKHTHTLQECWVQEDICILNKWYHLFFFVPFSREKPAKMVHFREKSPRKWWKYNFCGPNLIRGGPRRSGARANKTNWMGPALTRIIGWCLCCHKTLLGIGLLTFTRDIRILVRGVNQFLIQCLMCDFVVPVFANKLATTRLHIALLSSRYIWKRRRPQGKHGSACRAGSMFEC